MCACTRRSPHPLPFGMKCGHHRRRQLSLASGADVHRIGRTGRAGAEGESVTFWNPDYDKECAPALVRIARKAKQEVPEPLLKFGSTVKKKEHKMYGSFGPDAGAPMKQATRIVF